MQRNWGSRTAHLWQSRQAEAQKRNFTSWGMMAERKNGSGTSAILQSWKRNFTLLAIKVRVLAGKPNFRSLTAKAEQKCGSGTSHLWKSRQRRNAEMDLHIFGSPGRTNAKRNLKFSKTWQNRSLKIRISHLCQSRQSGSVEAKLQTFRSPGRAEVRKPNFISLAVKAGRKCRSGASRLRKSWQSRSAERNSCHVMGSRSKAEMRKWYVISLAVKAVWKRDGSHNRSEVRKRNFRSLAVNTKR